MVSEFFSSIANASSLPAVMLVLAMVSFGAVVLWADSPRQERGDVRWSDCRSTLPILSKNKERTVMPESHDKLLDHEYDGIRELDNDLPRWWVWLFYITIGWGILYFLYFHAFGIGYSSADQYRLEVDPNYERVATSGDRALGFIPEYRTPYYSPQRDAAFGSDKKRFGSCTKRSGARPTRRAISR